LGAVASLFPAYTEADWRRAAEAALNDAALESLVSETADGVRIEPVYPPAEGPRAIRPGGPWRVIARLDHPDAHEANAEALATKLLSLPDPPSAVFAASDRQAMGVLAAAERAARPVPGELSVMGFDDIEFAKLIGLSTVRQPLEDSGIEGARRLCALLRGEPIGPLRQQLPLEVVHRSTTARLRRSNRRRPVLTSEMPRLPQISAGRT